LAGIGVATAGVLGVGSAGASSGSVPYDGPFPRSYEAAVVDPTSVPLVSSDPGTPKEGEGEAGIREIPKKAPQANDQTAKTGGEVQKAVPAGDLVGTDFDGLSALDVRGVVPSDNQIAAGESALFQAINSRVAVFDKQGTKATVDHATAGTIEFEFTLDDWFQNVSPFIYEEGQPESPGDGYPSEFFEDYIIFDPRARYDAEAGRYLLCCVDFALSGDRAGEGGWLLSVSSTSDPTDPWYNYRIPPRPQQEDVLGLVDFPEIGFDAEAVYLTQNFFPGPFTQATMAALDKDALYAGETASANHFTHLRNPDGSFAFTVQPAAVETGSDVGHFVNTRFFQGQSLTVWTIEDPLGTDPTLSNDAVRVRPYHNAPAAQQPNTEEQIDTIDTRAMRVSFDGQHLWTAHTVGDGRVRWYEVDPTGPSVVQSGNFRRNGRPSFIPAIEANGESAAFVFNTTNPRNDGNGYVDVEVASVTGTSGTVDAYAVVKAGENDYDYVDGEAGEPDTGPQVMRWGDYNGISVDPTDGSYWVVGQYAKLVELSGDRDKEYFEDNYYGTRIANVSPE